MNINVCVCAYVRAFVCACVRVCVRACVRDGCVRAYVCIYESSSNVDMGF